MAQINAAYDLLRDPMRRATYDASAEGRRARDADGGTAGSWTASFGEDDDGPRTAGPPPPRRTPPVTARYDTSGSFRPRNARLEDRQPPMRGQPPISRRAFEQERDLRASTPTGPVERHRGARPERMPTITEALETPLEFGRYHGYTLGEVEVLEPAYLDWIARTITRDRELVTKARVIQGERNRRDVGRKNKSAAPRFGAAAG
jgi:curved DNA-binding protein CbpA